MFASRLSGRLRRLRDEAEQAIDVRGRVQRGFRASGDSDEIGDLSRSFATAVDRLAEYNEYLERMADRLSHELRTPIAVVSSSLDNLRTRAIPTDAQVYIARAEEGVRRLQRRPHAHERGDAARADAAHDRARARSISGASCPDASPATPPRSRSRASSCGLPERRIEIDGSPDLVAQLLDKLVDNARDFATAGRADRRSRSTREGGTARLSVSNAGPPLPEAMADRLFESMVSVRTPARRPTGRRSREASRTSASDSSSCG